MCDRISDTILDFYLQGDPNSRCQIETCGGNGKVFVTGEVTSNTEVTEDDIKSIVHNISGGRRCDSSSYKTITRDCSRS